MKLLRIVSICTALAVLTVGVANAQFGGRGGRGGRGGFGQSGPQFGQPAANYGQPSSGSTTPAKPAWTTFKLNPNIRVTLDFRNASVDAVLHYFSQQSGIAIIKDPALTGGITLESPKPQSLADAFTMLNVVLGLKSPAFELTKQSNFLLVSSKQQQQPQMPRQFGTSGGFGGESSNNSVLEVYVLHYASATTLANVINQVFTQTAAAAAVVGPGGGAGGPGGGPGGFRGRFGQAASSTGSGPQVHASADDYSNSLIINAPEAQQGEIASIIDQIDKPSDQPETARVFSLQYALASDLQSVVENILSGSVPLGRAATVQTTAQQRNGNQRGGFFNFFNRASTPNSSGNGTVTVDTRTNSLIVTSTDQNLAMVADVIKQLDKPATYESTTFVYTMQNARADVVANLLNESFGNRTTGGAVGGSLTNPTFDTASLGIAGSSTSGSTTGAGRTNNFTVSSSSGNNTLSQGDSTGLDENGKIVNIRNLSGQVVLVPNIDTNSIIVVCPPEDKQIVQDILDKMDEIPAQVMIKTLIVEANLTKADSFGVEYNFGIPGIGHHGSLNGSQNYGTVNSGTTIAPVPSQQNSAEGLPAGAQFTLSAGGYSAVLSAIQQDSNFNVLSTPRIFTTNNATAQINISQELPYVTNSTTDPSTGVQSFDYNFMNVGIVLTVTPRITSNGYVTMDVSQTANDFVKYTSFNAPIVNQRETQSTISVKDGDTIVLGGIIQNSSNNTVNKIPLLGDIPILGDLFRSQAKVNTKTELLVFLTPTVITKPSDAVLLKDQTIKEAVTSEPELRAPIKQEISQAPVVSQPQDSNDGGQATVTVGTPSDQGAETDAPVAAASASSVPSVPAPTSSAASIAAPTAP